MSAITVILIVGGLLLLYYAGMISYDMYMDKLSQATKDEDKEQTIDISGEAASFTPSPIEKPSLKDAKSRFGEMVGGGGLFIEKFSRIINSSEDALSKELENMYAMVEAS